VVRPYLAFDSVLCEALQHTLPQIIPPSHNEEIAYPLPTVVYRMFDYTDVPEVSQATCSVSYILLINNIEGIISHILWHKAVFFVFEGVKNMPCHKPLFLCFSHLK